MPTSSRDTTITLPDPWADWPWNRRLNPFYTGAKAESTSWIRSYELYNPDEQNAFDRSDFCLLASLAYPDLNAGQFRITCDFIQLTFAFDDRMERKDERSAQSMASSMTNALQAIDQPDRKDDVWGAITWDFWKRLTIVMPNPAYQRRFAAALRRYTESVVQEARDHHQGRIRDIPEYFVLRRETSALYPAWVLLHMGLDLPAEVFDDPVVQEIEQAAADMVIIGNDMVSYNPESSRGEHHNFISVLVGLHGLSIQEAMVRAGENGKSLIPVAENARSALKSFGGSVDADLTIYISGLLHWVKASDCWSFEGKRYFGEHGKSVQEHRQMVLHAAANP